MPIWIHVSALALGLDWEDSGGLLMLLRTAWVSQRLDAYPPPLWALDRAPEFELIVGYKFVAAVCGLGGRRWPWLRESRSHRLLMASSTFCGFVMLTGRWHERQAGANQVIQRGASISDKS